MKNAQFIWVQDISYYQKIEFFMQVVVSPYFEAPGPGKLLDRGNFVAERDVSQRGRQYDRADAEWVESVRAKIDAAIEASTHTPQLMAKPLFIGATT